MSMSEMLDEQIQNEKVYRCNLNEDSQLNEITFKCGESGNIDSEIYSLFDFIDGKCVDRCLIKDRADMMFSYVEDNKYNGKYHYKRESQSGSSPQMDVKNLYGETKSLINLASNDYLNLTKHPLVKKASIEAIEKYGVGTGSVPLLAGTLDIHNLLEKRLAEFKSCEDAMLYTSGFGTNYGVLSTLLGPNDIAILDRYVHASIIDGCKHTNVKFFKHNDMKSLEQVLQRHGSKYSNVIVVVDGVYSMDGDIAPLDKIVEVSHKYNALVMVDEAHATGVIGENGKGTPDYHNVAGDVDIVVGTLSKGLGGVGGFVASDKKIINYLRHLSRPYFFSTSLPPSVTAAMIECLNVLEKEPCHQEKLWKNIKYFKNGVLDLGFNIGNSETAIFPIILGDDLKVIEMSVIMENEGVMVNPIPFPAVPRKLSRIRMTLTAGLTIDQLDHTLDTLKRAGEKLKII